MKYKARKKEKFIPLLIAISVLCIMLFSSVRFVGKQKGEWKKDIRNYLFETLTSGKSRLEKALYSRIYYTKGVAAYVALHPDLTNEDFQNLAKLLIKNDSVISTMSLSKNCVIGEIYPEKGHTAAIGLDLMKHPQRKEIVKKTIETHQTFVAGPVELVEGGIAFISYTPIFNKMIKGEPFWGVTDIVIYRDRLFEDAKLYPESHDFEFALKGTDGTGDNGEIFWGNPEVFQNDPVVTKIDLPTGNWILAATPISGWTKYLNQDNLLYYILVIGSCIISLLCWLFFRALLKVRNNEKKLRAIFSSMHNLIIEYNQKGEYVEIAPTNLSLLALPEEQLLGKSVYDIFDRDLADLLYKSIQECLSQNKLVVLEYPLTINGKDLWFMGRISKKSDYSVIFNAYDITEKKKSEERILESEKRLKELNDMKDKLFSVIAHDLKNPVGSFVSLSNLLNDESGYIDDDQKKEILKLLQQSGSEAYELLNNLLSWALSQQNLIHIDKKKIRLKELCDQTVISISPLLSGKKIKLVNEISDDSLITGDENLTKTIVRNLISNAIKFSYEGGTIRLNSNFQDENGNTYCLLKVSDEGMGMKPETIANLFGNNRAKTVPGTRNETGTGLGLMLCRDFIEKQGGFIDVKSQPGKGSVFIVRFPE